MLDICIIGGGASAMAAAITAARQNPLLKICILEKKEQLGKKLAATGNGKCNMTNAVSSNVKETLRFFASLGVITRTDEEGRIYPYSMQAKDVVYGLVRQLNTLNVEIKLNCPAEKIKKTPEGFVITYKGGTLTAQKVLIAAGGKAGPQFGTTGDGYGLAKDLGHTITKLAPILTGLEIAEFSKSLKGIRMKGCVKLYKEEEFIAEEQGDVQFTEDGISGICIFNLSRFIKLAPGESYAEGMAKHTVRIDFLPHMTQEQAVSFLTQRCEIVAFEACDLFLSVIPYGLANVLLDQLKIERRQWAKDIPEEKIVKLAELIKGWNMRLEGMKGWKTAQCTAGGVDLKEIELKTMESKLVDSLYFSGEVLDFDGPCGGFNLQNAWETGIKAGKAMAVSMQTERA